VFLLFSIFLDGKKWPLEAINKSNYHSHLVLVSYLISRYHTGKQWRVDKRSYIHHGTQVIVIVIDLKIKNRGCFLSYFSFFDNGGREINHGGGTFNHGGPAC